MKEIIRKLSSRKLWLSIAGVAAGLSMALGVEVSDIQAVAGAVTAICSVITYIVTEGKIDAERVKVAIEETQKAVETIEGTEG
jgi:phage shock protein PspC (stress-responsive transcriptional regulator)